MRINFKTYFLLATILASTILGAVSAFPVAAQSSDEKLTGYASSDLTQQVKDSTYKKVMKQCLDRIYTSPASGLATASMISSGSNWLSYTFEGWADDGDNNDYMPAAGYIVDPADDGNLSCRGDAATIISGYKTAIGQPTMSNIELVCSLGYKPVKEDLTPTGGDCVGEGSNPAVQYKLLSPPSVPGADTPYSDAQRYLAYRFAFLNRCGAKPIGLTKDRTTTVTEGIYRVAIVYEDGTSEYVDYTMDKPDQNLSVLFLEKRKCKDLVTPASDLNDLGLMDQTHQAYKTWLTTEKKPGDKNEDDSTTGTGTGGDAKPTCVVEGVGWIVCPVVRLMASIVDEAYGYVATLLTVQPLLTTGNSGTSADIYKAWAVMRNFANVAFVIAFLFIIFSQLTSIGISNYGIKKMLPRLVIAAILVNASFWICAAAVDISNIAGSSMRELFHSIQADIAPPDAAKVTTGTDTGTGWAGIAGFVLVGAGATTALLYVGLSALLPALIAAIVAIVTVFIVLTIRQALIILLIVVSPLAFVAYLLPNTESYFKRWRELLQVLLLMYPIIAAIFGVSALASGIVMSSAVDYEPKLRLPIQIMGALISIVPLAITPIVMRTAGGLLNRFGGMVNNPNKGLVDRANRSAEAYRKRAEGRREINALNDKRVFGAGKFKRRAKRNAIEAGIESNVKRAQASYVAEEAENNAAFRNRTAGGTTIRQASDEAKQQALANAINVQAKLEADEVSAANAIIQNANLTLDQMQELAKGQTVRYMDKDGVTQRSLTGTPGSALQTAALQSQFAAGDVGKTDELVAMSGSMGVKQRQVIGDGMLKLSSKVQYYGGAASDIVKQGNVKSKDDLNALVADTINGGKFSGEGLNSADKDALTRISEVATSGPITRTKTDGTGGTETVTIKAAAYDKLRDAAFDALTNPNLTQPTDRIRSRVTAIEKKIVYTDATAPTPPPRPVPGTASTYTKTP